MAHLFDPTGNAIRVGKQAALLTLLPIRLMNRPRHRAPQLIEILVTIFQTTEQSHFHNGLTIKLQRVWVAFYPSMQRRSSAEIVIEIEAEVQRFIPLLSGIPVSVGVIRSKQWQILPCPVAGWACTRATGAARFAWEPSTRTRRPAPDWRSDRIAGEFAGKNQRRAGGLVEFG